MLNTFCEDSNFNKDEIISFQLTRDFKMPIKVRGMNFNLAKLFAKDTRKIALKLLAIGEGESTINLENIEISNICNLQCSFCPAVVRTKKLMGLELFERVIQQVAPLTEQVAFHLMGDPLVHPELEQMIEICATYGVRIFFVTNGVLIKSRGHGLLLHPAMRQVNFSLHSFHDNFPERDATAYLDSIFAFTDEALATRPDLYINYRLWNLHDVRGDRPENRSMMQAIEARYGAQVPRDLDVRSRKSYRLKGRLYLHFDTEFKWPSTDLPIIGTQGKCYGLSTHFGILADGSVVPCCLDKEGAITLGNLKTQSIEEILRSERAQAMLDGFRRRALVESLCQRCNYIERFGVRV